jgi:serine/threonine protein kinase
MSDEARSRSPVPIGAVVGGKYRVDRIVGSGGMGVVVAATHTELHQAVALKFILPEAISGKEAVERFMREARSVARLKSEHVARVFDVGRDENDNPYMVLELLEGADLATLSKRKGPLTIADSVEYVLQACEALVEAHAAGIVHRDLKPQNIFVSRRLNGTPLVKVLDFGIAKAVGAAAVGQLALTDSQAVMGSPLYMAPEHMRSARAADVRSDVWSLGVILYELIGGQLPFDGETVTEVCIRVVNEAPPSLLSLRPGLEPKLAALVMRCLEKDPGARWQNVAQLAMALEPFSRSAQQGAAIRPWRSFEDTMDSRPPQAPPRTDGTGPSTTVTMPTGADIAGALRAASTPGFQPGVPAAEAPWVHAPSAPPRLEPSEPPRLLVSTGVTWRQGTDPAGVLPPPRRSPFTMGIAVGVVASIVAVVAFIVGLRSSRPAEAPAPLPPSAAVEPASASPAPPSSLPAASEAPLAPAEAVVTPASLPTALPVSSAKPRAPVPQGRTRSTTRTAQATATTAPVPSVVPSDTQAPNGAPILR